MSECTRRSFVKGGALALVALGAAPRFLVRTALAQERAGRPKVLIAIFQRDAVDGLSMVVPHGDPDYYGARGSIAIARPAPGVADTTVDLDGFFGLHPSLAPLKPLWDDRCRAVSFGAALPRILRGDVGAVAMTSVSEFDVKEGAGMAGRPGARQGFESMYEKGVRDLLYGTGRETFEAVKMLKAAAPQRLGPDNGAVYPRGRFGDSLRQIAQLIRADVGLEVAFADVGGWDTHAGQGNERGQLATRLREFGEGLAALDRDLGVRMSDVVVLTMSEFGRTVRENGNRGTDHG